MKLTRSEIEILGYLIYPETFARILEETGMNSGALRDDLTHLVSHGYVEVLEIDGKRSVSPFYDIDRLHLFAFRATRSGLSAIRSGAR